MPVSQEGAQRASRHRSFRLVVVALMASVFAIGGLASNPTPVAAAGKKVVIVVGPAGSNTANYIYNAKKLAAQARSYGATVYELYSPHATWARVKQYAQGANLFIYLGHGNGYPSPYGAFSKYSKDGLGLNTVDGSTRHTYYGEYYVDRYLQFAPNAVVILNRLCYASGNNEWGAGNPTKATAIKRVDNYGAGFLRTGARAVFAARFVPGLRTVAGPLAGAGGLPPLRFFAANLLCAICYVPWPVLAGYGVGYGVGDRLERLRRATGLFKEDAALFGAILALAGVAFIVMVRAKGRRAAGSAAP